MSLCPIKGFQQPVKSEYDVATTQKPNQPSTTPIIMEYVASVFCPISAH